MNSLAARLLNEPYIFDFFQAVRLLSRMSPTAAPVGRATAPRQEIARFRAHLALTFPPSSLYELEAATDRRPPLLTVAFMGLTGPNGVLPRHYTELLLRLEREGKWTEKGALRAWFDIFNHRFISLFYRAWEKYRFFLPYERGEPHALQPDQFTQSLYCLLGLGLQPLRNRLQVCFFEEKDDGDRVVRSLARLEDLSLLYFSGYFTHRPRCVVALENVLQEYFQLPVKVEQFRRQWLILAPENQSRLGTPDGNNLLGMNLVAGERVEDVQSRFRIRLGPLTYLQFGEFLPDRSRSPQRKTLFLLMHLVRLYVGAEFDFDVQLVLRAEEVPACQLVDAGGMGPRLGWNTWACTGPRKEDADDAFFDGEEITYLN